MICMQIKVWWKNRRQTQNRMDQKTGYNMKQGSREKGPSFQNIPTVHPWKTYLPQQNIQTVGAWRWGKKQDWINSNNQNITMCQFLTVLSPVSILSQTQTWVRWFYSLVCIWKTEGNHASILLWNIWISVL